VISRGIDLSEVAIMAGSWQSVYRDADGMPAFWAALLALAVALSIAPQTV